MLFCAVSQYSSIIMYWSFAHFNYVDVYFMGLYKLVLIHLYCSTILTNTRPITTVHG